jgi:ABC-type Fe2+-enterobactin transport system substrate-binding protein
MAYIGSVTGNEQQFAQAVDYFNGDGATVAFTLSRPVATTTQVQVVVNNVIQNPSSAYTVLNNVITFTSAPSQGSNNIYVYYPSQVVFGGDSSGDSVTPGTGGGSDRVFIQNSQVVNTSYTVPAGLNAMSAGPIEIAANATVTITDGSYWTIV